MDAKRKQKIRDKITSGKIYGDRRYKAWRKRIFKRDGYQCQFPGCKHKMGQLNAHHIKMKFYFPELIFKVLNGITLCKKHHTKVHKEDSDNYIELFQKIAKSNGAKGRIISKRTIKPRKKKE